MLRNTIEVVRGTTVPLEIEIRDADGALYGATSVEKVIFGVKKNLHDTECVFVKTANMTSVGIYHIEIEIADTRDLDAGMYFYDVGVMSGNRYHNVIPPRQLIIREHVTEWGCA